MKRLKIHNNNPFISNKENIEHFLKNNVKNNYKDNTFIVIDSEITSSIYIKIIKDKYSVLIRISDHKTSKHMLTYYTENGMVKPKILMGTIINGVKRLRRKTTYNILRNLKNF